ncbi:hypothetical protein EZV62_024499 [Acer yangbiense]|uniref:ALBINO3-like protein 2, chloroplastic n=1 Tax=Acer yangbiense TaxID=1000413 RepID=A0A5C7GV05_9ROSI|nr:hypothetical protein EZV62_024499 [Acer yangbiense]
MATSRLILSHLRRSHAPLHHALCSLLPSRTPPLHPSYFPPRLHFPPAAAFHFFHSRSIDDDSGSDSFPIPSEMVSCSEGVSQISSGEDSILPVRALISLLDCFHNLTGFPWWITIASSALALRILMFPAVVLQMKKLKRIAELFPKLPPPLPPPLSGRSFIDQISLFRRERIAIGCPSFLWFLASFSIQVPCFLLFVTSIRRMSLDGHPGFDCGGTLWFQNLTETSNGVIGSGSIFPILIAALHYINVQISFRKSSLGKDSGMLGLLAKYYKSYLDILTLPLLFTGYCIPQSRLVKLGLTPLPSKGELRTLSNYTRTSILDLGFGGRESGQEWAAKRSGSLVYWVTNSSLSVIQNLSLQHPAIRSKLGLPDKDARTAAAKFEQSDAPEMTFFDSTKKQHKVSAKDLKPKELLAVSIHLMSKDQKEQAISLLQLALDKDPDYVQPLIVMGQILVQKGLLVEAIESLERAISKLCFAGHPTEDEDIDLLIVASQGAGLAYMQQDKMAEGIVHLERIGNMQEPDEPKTKAHYFDGLVLLSSALYNMGRKAEAAEYLRLAAAYNPAYNRLLEQCEKDEGDFASDLVNSRRRDY